MKKNGFLTFIFACIPGAGQMYYGYMQRGLSIAIDRKSVGRERVCIQV